MIRRFENLDAKSNRFWEITIKGKTVTVRYGRIGTDGQTRAETHATPTEAKRAAEMQVAEQVKQGYREVGGASRSRLKASATSSRKAPARKAPARKAPARKVATTTAEKSVTTSGAAAEPLSVTIGTQTWMVENLNVDRFRNGDVIAEAPSETDWELAGENGEPAWCYYENQQKNGSTYGKLYNWHAVNDERGLAPAGWRVPSSEDWIELYNNSPDKDQFARRIVRAAAWGDESDRESNASGFSALPAGQRFFNTLLGSQFPVLMFFGNGSYTGSGIGSLSSWWTSAAKDADNAFLFSVTNFDGRSFGKDFFFRRGYYLKSGGFSVRCIEDRSTSHDNDRHGRSTDDSSDDFHAMVAAYKRGDLDEVAELTARGNPPLQMNGDDSVIENELIAVCAAPEVDLRALERVIKRGDDLNARNIDSDRYTSVHFCAWDGKVEALAMLLKHGASPDLTGGDGRTALHLAAANGHARVVELLLSARVEVDRRIPRERSSQWHSDRGSTAIRDALVNQHWGVIELLIGHGADIVNLTEPCAHHVEGADDLFAVIRILHRQGAYSHQQSTGGFDDVKLSNLENEARKRP